MGFFKGASNIQITGGQFNQLTNGNQIIHDQRSYHNNINSFNTNNTTTIDSHNDKSITSYGNNSPLQPGGIDRRRSVRDANHAKDDIAQYFPPPTIHPALQPPVPPGYGPAYVSHVNSYNIDNTRILDSHNDYSQYYGVRKRPATPSTATKRSRRRYEDESDTFPPQVLSGTPRTRISRGKSGTTYAQYDEGDIQTMDQDMQHTLATLMRQVQGRTAPPPPVSAYEYEHAQGYEDEQEGGDAPDEDGEEGSDCEEEEEQQSKRMPNISAPSPPSVTLTHRLANLTLEELQAGPSSSSRSRPTPPSQDGEDSTDESQEEDESEEEEEEGASHPKGSWSPNIPPVNLNIPPLNIPSPNIPPLPANLGPSFPPSGPPYRPRQSSRPSRGPPFPTPNFAPQRHPPLNTHITANPNPNAILGAFNLPASAVRGGAVFNTVHGDMVQVDQSVHMRNINSGNTTNKLVKDSYNHAPVTVYGSVDVDEDDTAPPKSRKGKGRPPRKMK